MTMIINQNREGNQLTISLEGRLDTATAPELEAVIDTALTGVETLVMDLEQLEYVSSAGLRVFLKMQKLMNTQGAMKIIHVNETIMEVFDITGFVDILTIE